MIPLFSKADRFEKTNYRPVSHISKVFERVIYNQINEYIEPFLSKVLTGFRKNHNTQHSLLNMLESFKEALDKVTSVSTIFMNLSKAFDILNHDLLIAKLEAYGFSAKSLSCIHSYLNKRLQKTIVNCEFSLRKEIFSGVPQGSILGPLLFNVYINDIFFFVDVIFLSNYADDTALYSVQKTHILNQSVLKKNFTYLQKWFHDNLQFIFYRTIQLLSINMDLLF